MTVKDTTKHYKVQPCNVLRVTVLVNVSDTESVRSDTFCIILEPDRSPPSDILFYLPTRESGQVLSRSKAENRGTSVILDCT